MAAVDTHRRLPVLRWLPAYSVRHLRGDVTAGLIVAALLVPQALGYSGIANVPVQIGLYAVPGALLAYAIFGSSRNLVVGPASTVAVVSGTLVADMGLNGEAAVGATAAMAVVAGIVLIAIGLLRIGWVAEFLSAPIVTGFVFGLTLVIVVGEIPAILGIPKEGQNVVSQSAWIIRHLGETGATSLAVGCAALLLVFGGSRLSPRVPWSLLLVVLGVAVSGAVDLSGRGVAVVGDVPAGLPPVGLPTFPWEHMEAVVFGGISLALVGLAEGLSAARLFAARSGLRVDAEQELIATGASNVAAGLSGGLTVAGSLSKTAAAERSGGRSQVTGLTAGVIVILVLLFFTGFFTDLPKPVLSAIVIHAVWGLMDLDGMRRFREVRQADFVAATSALVGVALFGPLNGLVIAIGVSLLGIIYRSSRLQVEPLGRIPHEKAAWGRVASHPDRRPVEGIVVLRLDGPLFWVNAVAVSDRVVDLVAAHPGTRAVVLDLELTPRLDVTSADMLTDLMRQLRAQGCELYLVHVMRLPRGVLARAGFIDELGEGHVWRSISQGVRAARRDTGLKIPRAARSEKAGPRKARRLKRLRRGRPDAAHQAGRTVPLPSGLDLATDDDLGDHDDFIVADVEDEVAGA